MNWTLAVSELGVCAIGAAAVFCAVQDIRHDIAKSKREYDETARKARGARLEAMEKMNAGDYSPSMTLADLDQMDHVGRENTLHNVSIGVFAAQTLDQG